jgi:hypothetical protein
MGSIMGVVPCGHGMIATCAIPVAVNCSYNKWGLMRRAATPVQPAMTAGGANAARKGDLS